MSRVLVFAPWIDGDVALWNSRWIARQTTQRLVSPRVIEDHEALRNTLLENTGESEYLGLHCLAEALVDRMVTSR